MESVRQTSTLSRRTLLAGMGAFALSACTDSSKSPTNPAPEVPEIRLGVLEVTDTAPLFVAQREGIFAKYGLNPKFVTMELTGDQRPDLEQGGQADVTFDSWVTIFLNIIEGPADWVVLGEAYQAAPRTTGLVIAQSGINRLRSVADLRGKPIGVNNKRGLGVLLTNSLLRLNGLQPADVNYVELPFDQLANATASGQVAASWMVEPYMTRSQLETKCVMFADTAVGPTADFPQSGYACARSFARRNPNTVRAFQLALAEAQQRALDRSLVEAVLPDYIKVSKNVAQLMNMGAYPSTTLAIRPQRVADLMVEQQLLKTRIDVSSKMATVNPPS